MACAALTARPACASLRYGGQLTWRRLYAGRRITVTARSSFRSHGRATFPAPETRTAGPALYLLLPSQRPACFRDGHVVDRSACSAEHRVDLVLVRAKELVQRVEMPLAIALIRRT